jgi:hypothetical protein
MFTTLTPHDNYMKLSTIDSCSYSLKFSHCNKVLGISKGIEVVRKELIRNSPGL